MRKHFEQVDFGNQIMNGHRSFRIGKDNRFTPKRTSKEKIVNDQRSLSPWIFDDRKQSYSLQSSNNNQNKFLSKILFRKKKIQQYSSSPVTKQIQQNIYQQPYQKIIVFPKSASQRHPNSLQREKILENQIFGKKTLKHHQRQIKQSKIVSIDLDLQKTQEISMNPQILINKSKNLNPYLRNQKKRQLLKFKIKHNNRLTIYYEKERQNSLQKQLKFLTDAPKTSHQFRSPNRIRINNPHTKEKQKSLENVSLFCQGQIAAISTASKRNKIKNMTIGSFDHTIFLV